MIPDDDGFLGLCVCVFAFVLFMYLALAIKVHWFVYSTLAPHVKHINGSYFPVRFWRRFLRWCRQNHVQHCFIRCATFFLPFAGFPLSAWKYVATISCTLDCRRHRHNCWHVTHTNDYTSHCATYVTQVLSKIGFYTRDIAGCHTNECEQMSLDNDLVGKWIPANAPCILYKQTHTIPSQLGRVNSKCVDCGNSYLRKTSGTAVNKRCFISVAC